MKAGHYLNIMKCSFCGSKHTKHLGNDKRFIRECFNCFGIEINGDLKENLINK